MLGGTSAAIVEAEAMIAAMKAGDEMVLAARSARGNETSYTFSLDGVTAASRLLENCR